MIDNKGRLFGKINVIDLCVVLVVFLAVCTVAFKFGFSRYAGIDGMASNPPNSVEYVVRFGGVRDFTVESIKAGDKIYNEADETYLGTITDIEVESAKEYIAMADGTIRMVNDPTRYDVFATVKCNANLYKGTYYVDIDDVKKKNRGTEICEHAYLKIYSTRFSSMAQITEVK